jgi:predicted transcriptional regulator
MMRRRDPVPQKISVDSDLWKRVRRLAFDMGTTATSIVEEALIAYFAAMELKQGGRLAKAPQPMSFSAEGTLIPDFSGNHAISLMPDGSVMDPIADVPRKVEIEDGAYVRIENPSQVAAAVKAAGPREFHPVPKPVTAKKARR